MRENLGYKFKGEKDPDRGNDVVLRDHGVFHYLKPYLKKVEEIPPAFEEFSEAKPPLLVGVHCIL